MIKREPALRNLFVMFRLAFIAALFGFQGISNATEEVRPRLNLQTGHTAAVNAVAFSQDDKLIASASSDKTVKLWDVKSGKEVRTLGGYGSVSSVHFLPDGKSVVTLDYDARVWDVRTGLQIQSFSGGDDSIKAIAVTTDGLTLITATQGEFRVWDLKSGRLRKSFRTDNDGGQAVAVSPDGKTLAFARSGNSIQIQSIERQGIEIIATGHLNSIRSIAFSPNGRHLATASADATIRIWDTRSGREISKMCCSSQWNGFVSFSPDGASVGLVHGRAVRIFNVRTRRETRNLNDHIGDVNALAFSRNGRLIASASDDRTVGIWVVKSGEGLNSLEGRHEAVYGVRFSPAGKTLSLIANNDPPRIFGDALQLELQAVESEYGRRLGLRDFEFDPSGKTLVAANFDGKVIHWDIASGRAKKVLEAHSSAVTTVKIFDGGRSVISGGSDKSLKQWSLPDWKMVREFIGHARPITHAAVSSDGKILASGDSEGTIKIWDISSGNNIETIRNPESTSLTFLKFHPSERVVVFGGGGLPPTLRRIDGESNIRSFGLEDNISAAVFGIDGRVLVVAGYQNNIKIWSVEDGTLMATLYGHNNQINSIDVSADGKLLASSSSDGTVRLWQLPAGNPLVTVFPLSDGKWVVADSDGRFDTNDIESIREIHWVMPDAPFTPVELDVFLKEYFEPRLLQKVMAGSPLIFTRPVVGVNRSRPMVEIVSVRPVPGKPSEVRVDVSTSGTSSTYFRGGAEITQSTATYDLHLFRDNQLVGVIEGKLANFSDPAVIKTFTVQLPTFRAGSFIKFSAYAFNDDGVKGETANFSFTNTNESPQEVGIKGRAYIIAMGVNKPNNPSWNLSFAANDARVMTEQVGNSLRNTLKFSEVIALTLIADDSSRSATKATLRAVLGRLAGSSKIEDDKSNLQDVAGSSQLRRASPDDLILLAFSGHGFTDDTGRFFLIPQDTGSGTSKEITPELKARSISFDELAAWIKPIDAGDLTLIIDACQSEASVNSGGFRPGPLGARSFGQLAFNKRMKVLAASQTAGVAIESGILKHGLLTYSLIHEGLDQFNADEAPEDRKIYIDEWLKYGLRRVPRLVDNILKDASDASDSKNKVKAVWETISGQEKLSIVIAQQPELFNFSVASEKFLLGIR